MKLVVFMTLPRLLRLSTDVLSSNYFHYIFTWLFWDLSMKSLAGMNKIVLYSFVRSCEFYIKISNIMLKTENQTFLNNNVKQGSGNQR